ncbi:MAG: hypothetical protein HOO86_01830 [Bacteroidales bacterium]|nr:hypothetical protein [Bacteroidales bacterium]
MRKVLFTFLFFTTWIFGIGCTCLNEKILIQQEKKLKNQQELFDDFLGEFVKAYKSNDTLSLLLLCNTPVEMLGRQDSDPSFSVYGTDIIAPLIYVIEYGGYYDVFSDKSIENIKLLETDYKKLIRCDLDSKECRINDFVFAETKDGWKLVQLYLDTRKYFKKK